MKSYLMSIGFALLLFSCSSKNSVPSAIIQPEKMKSILWDVMRAQTLAAAMQRQDSAINNIAETKMLAGKIFEIHDVSEAAFNKSYSWYVKHPEALKLIFDSMYVQKQRDFMQRAQAESQHDSIQPKIKIHEQSF